MRVTRFEQLDPGELFLSIDGPKNVYAMKTEKRPTRDRNEMVLLGPQFVQNVAESSLVPWQPVTVLSLGNAFTIILSNDPASWSLTRLNRQPVWLAIAGSSTYICTNGGESPMNYFSCFVDIKTGAVIEGSLPDTAAFTNTWEIVVLGADHLPRTILKYPLESARTTAM
jgi:hypothetical protein